MTSEKSRISAEAVILIAVFILSNFRAFLFFSLFPSLSWSPLGLAWIEIALWVVIFILAARVLARNGLFSAYWACWRTSWVVSVLVLLALLSLLWSVSPIASLFRWLEFAFATALAFYLCAMYDLRQILNWLAWCGVYVALLGILLAIFVPDLGTMMGYLYHGAWRGLFWHRNHFGSSMALFNLVYLFQIPLNASRNRTQAYFWGFFYVFTVLLTFLSRSASGVILLLLLNFAYIALLAWMRFKSRMRPFHYYALGFVLLMIAVAGFWNLDPLLGLFGRNSTLTGRLGLWGYLLGDAVSQRPVLGHGFGSIWNDASFRVETARAIGWDFAVLIGDNGFIDVLLHLGLVGLGIFGALIIIALARSVRFAFTRQTLAAFFPLLFMIYALIANITFSLFMETEMFIWILMLVVLAKTDPRLDTQP